MFTNKYWLQISAILKPDFKVVRNLKKKVKGGLSACRLYKKDSQYKLAKAIFIDAIDTIVERVSDGHMVVVNNDVFFQVNYKKINSKVGSPYADVNEEIIAGKMITYIFFHFYGNKVKIIPSKRITEKMIRRMAEGYRFTRKILE